MKRLLVVESRLTGLAGCSKVLLWMFLVCRVVDGVKLLTVPSVFAVVAEPAVVLRVRARGLMPRVAWVRSVSPEASKTLAKPGAPAPVLVAVLVVTMA